MIPSIKFDAVNSFDKTITFLIEVAVDDEVRLRSRGREAVGGDGQTSAYALDYTEETIDLRFNWMTQDIKEQVFFWMIGFGNEGDAFRYFPDSTDATRYFECKLVGNRKDANFRRAHPRVVLFDISLRARVIAISAQVQTDRDAFYP